MFSSHNHPKMKAKFLYESSLSSSNQLDFHYFDPQIHSNSNGSSSLNPMFNGVHQTSSATVNFHDNYEPNPFIQNGGHVQLMFNSFLLHHAPNPKEIMGSNRSQINFSKKSFNRAGQGRQKNINIVKGKWSIEEDRLLSRLVDKYGETKWCQIAQKLAGRLGKQCRDRWKNHLRPDIKKDAWSEEEDKVLIQSHIQMGNKWSEIAKILPGRTENTIKNHWNATKRKEYSKRKRNTKYPRGNLLQDYIRSLNLDSEGPSATAAETPGLSLNLDSEGPTATAFETPGLSLLQLQPQAMEFNQINNQSLVPNYGSNLDFDDEFQDGSFEFLSCLLEDMDNDVSFVDDHITLEEDVASMDLPVKKKEMD